MSFLTVCSSCCSSARSPGSFKIALLGRREEGVRREEGGRERERGEEGEREGEEERGREGGGREREGEQRR